MTEDGRARFTLRNDTAELDGLRSFVDGFVSGTDLSAAALNKIVLAVDEAVSNIIQHAYDEHSAGTIDVELENPPGRLIITIRDSGRTFDPSNYTEPELKNHISTGRRRGLGIFLMRQIMDEVHYNFKEGVRNELVLIKSVGEGAAR